MFLTNIKAKLDIGKHLLYNCNMNQDIVKRIRSFNRFYVRNLGLLESSILDSGYSLTESHILNELYYNSNSTATSINKVLNLDEGYLSRVIKKLSHKILLIKEQSTYDKRVYLLNLSENGRNEFKKLDQSLSESVKANIKHLNKTEKQEFANLLERAKQLLAKNKMA